MPGRLADSRESGVSGVQRNRRIITCPINVILAAKGSTEMKEAFGRADSRKSFPNNRRNSSKGPRPTSDGRKVRASK